jgi:hypothetical protein
MNFTYKQPYVTWKGPSTGSAVPTWSRPLINDNSNTNTGTSFAARPIKHWRKQLVPAANTGISKNAGVGMPMDRPGGSVYLGATNDCSNCPVNLYELIPTTKDTIFDNTKASDGECVACNPETNIIKSGITLLNKNYYSDTKAYLQSLCQTYDQKLSSIPIPGNSYINTTTHYPIPPSDSPTGSQLYYTENCSKKCATENSFVRTVYKPNNQQYAQQGAVSSSSRLTRLKNNTITKNGNSFNSAWGQQGANAGKYQGTSDGSYFLKTKNQECVPPHRSGNKTTSCIVTFNSFNPPCIPIEINISTIATDNGENNWSVVENKTIELCEILNIDNNIFLTINSDITLTVLGNINNNTGSTIYNDGQIIINTGGTLDNTGYIENIFIITNNGQITNNNGGEINTGGGGKINNNNQINNNSGGIINVNAGGELNNNSGGIINNYGGTITTNLFGTINNNNGATIYNSNNGYIDITSGAFNAVLGSSLINGVLLSPCGEGNLINVTQTATGCPP